MQPKQSIEENCKGSSRKLEPALGLRSDEPPTSTSLDHTLAVYHSTGQIAHQNRQSRKTSRPNKLRAVSAKRLSNIYGAGTVELNFHHQRRPRVHRFHSQSWQLGTGHLTTLGPLTMLLCLADRSPLLSMQMATGSIQVSIFERRL